MKVVNDSSKFRILYHNALHGSKMADRTMKDVYNKVQKYYNRRYERDDRFPVCYSRQPSYYEQL